MSQIYF